MRQHILLMKLYVLQVLIDALVKAITYYQVGAFPGHTPARTQAYWRSRRLFDVLIDACAPKLGVKIERVSIPVDGDVVQGYQILPLERDRIQWYWSPMDWKVQRKSSLFQC
jgi:hypothetical protein